MNKLLTILHKELTEVRRDRRSLMAAFAYALFGPLVVGLVINLIWSDASKSPDLRVAIEAQQEVSAVAGYLRSQGFAVDGEAALTLHLSDSFAQDLASGQQATMTIRGDLAEEERTAAALRKALNGFGALVAQQRLIGRGVAPSAIAPVRVELEDASLMDTRAEGMLTMLLLFFILAPFFSSMSSIIDSTAGERERYSIEALLTRPTPPGLLVGGKWLSGAIIGVLGTAATAIAGKVVLDLAPIHELGIGLALEWRAVVTIVLLLLPLTLLVAALQLVIALGAKSYKEGQSYLTLLSFAPAVVGFMAQSDTGLGNLPVPIFFEIEAMSSLLSGGQINLPLLFTVIGSYSATTLFLLMCSAKLLGHTRLLEAV